jgi:hypothetical protein
MPAPRKYPEELLERAIGMDAGQLAKWAGSANDTYELYVSLGEISVWEEVSERSDLKCPAHRRTHLLGPDVPGVQLRHQRLKTSS